MRHPEYVRLRLRGCWHRSHAFRHWDTVIKFRSGNGRFWAFNSKGILFCLLNPIRELLTSVCPSVPYFNIECQYYRLIKRYEKHDKWDICSFVISDPLTFQHQHGRRSVLSDWSDTSAIQCRVVMFWWWYIFEYYTTTSYHHHHQQQHNSFMI